MDLAELIEPAGVFPSLDATNKKQALQELSVLAADLCGGNDREIFEALLQRERLGSTALGRGIAIPHVKLKSLQSIVCVLARLKTPIEFESSDGEPVDLIFVLLAPEHAGGDHLKALARISRLVREPATLELLRSAPDAAAIRNVLAKRPTSHAA